MHVLILTGEEIFLASKLWETFYLFSFSFNKRFLKKKEKVRYLVDPSVNINKFWVMHATGIDNYLYIEEAIELD
jgi:hypothetical protein